MKKQIITLLFLICTAAGLAAETGYRGYEWYSNTWTFPATDRVIKLEEIGIGYNSPFIYEKNIMGDKTFLIFDFDTRTYELVAAGYLIPKEKTTELKNKFINLKKEELKTSILFEEYEIDEDDIKELGEIRVKGFVQYCIFTDCENLTRWFELEREEFNKEALDPKGPGTITIYDYNDDTRCFVFEGTYPGYTVVVYAPHEQDY